MSNYFMGAELAAEELPLGTPVPREIPPEGVIVPRSESGGWTRKYLHQMGRNPICIAEIPPRGAALSGRYSELVELSPAPAPAPVRAPEPQGNAMLPVSSPIPMSQPVRVPVPGSNSPFMMGGPVQMRSVEGPVQVRQAVGTPVSNLHGEMALARNPVRLGQTIPGMPAAMPSPVLLGTPLSVVTPDASAPASPSLGAEATCGVCPTESLQLPDGKIVRLEDTITLQDLCLMMPAILKSLQVACGAPGAQPAAAQPFGQGPIPVQKAAGGGFPGFGPASGMFGQGGGGGGGGGGLPGSLGVVNQNAPQGAGSPGGPGPVGPQGPPGLGTVVDFVTKTDADFTAGPGAFIPVPGTLLSFTQGADGIALVFLNAIFGCGLAANNALGIRFDGGAVIPLQAVVMTGTVTNTYQATTAFWPQFLTSGLHTIEVMLRGFDLAEVCAGGGSGASATLAALPGTPVALAVLHS